jgi:hypothetical protein
MLKTTVTSCGLTPFVLFLLLFIFRMVCRIKSISSLFSFLKIKKLVILLISLNYLFLVNFLIKYL